MSWEPTWSAQQVPNQQGLHSDTPLKECPRTAQRMKEPAEMWNLEEPSSGLPLLGTRSTALNMSPGSPTLLQRLQGPEETVDLSAGDSSHLEEWEGVGSALLH